jgi:hypothetical protein
LTTSKSVAAIHFQTDRERRCRADLRDCLLHLERIGPELLVAERVVPEDTCLPSKPDCALPMTMDAARTYAAAANIVSFRIRPPS